MFLDKRQSTALPARSCRKSMLVLMRATLLSAAAIAATPAIAADPVEQAHWKNVEQATEQVLSVDINSATPDEISEVLSGVGAAKANAIVSYRETHGPFQSPADLLKVKGIGQGTLDKNRKRIRM